MGGSKVFCKGCAYLFYLGGKTAPMCILTASFVGGPIRPRIDVLGIVDAEVYNSNNDCEYKRLFSFRARSVKQWLLWRLNDGHSGEKIREAPLKEYPVSAENSRRKRGKEESEPVESGEDEEGFGSSYPDDEEASEGDEASEDLFDDGGDSGDDKRGPISAVDGEIVENT